MKSNQDDNEKSTKSLASWWDVKWIAAQLNWTNRNKQTKRFEWCSWCLSQSSWCKGIDSIQYDGLDWDQVILNAMPYGDGHNN